MSEAAMLFPDVDFATASVPELHSVLDALREQAPVAPVVYHGVTTWLITRYEPLMQAFADETTFPSAAMYRIHSQPVMGKTLQCMEGEEHRISRALVSHAFRPKLVEGFIESLLEPVANDVIDEFAADGECELVSSFTHRYPMRLITRLLGIPVDHEDRFLEWAMGLINYPWDPDGALAASAEFTSYLRPLVAERRSNPGEDLLSELAGAEVEGHRLSDEEIFSFVRLLFPAGSDTTYKALGSLLATLFGDPALLARVCSDPAQVHWAIEESLRFEPPVALLPRMCAEDTTWAGVPLAAGTPMLFGIAAANRDPDVYPDPHRFDLDRHARHILSFGHGQHFCLGSHLARREMEVALGTLLRRLPALRLQQPGPVPIEGAVIRGPAELKVAWDT
jgi:cytochrome P450